MHRRAANVAIAIILGVPSWGSATLTVDPAQPITRRVTVQPIQTALDNGTSPATVFGDATQQASIEAAIDTIWAQAGIDILFLPTLVRFNDTIAYQGGSGADTRPTSDLNVILARATSHGGILNSDRTVINMFFVNVVPGFKPLGSFSVAGITNVGTNGEAVFVGTGLLTNQSNRETAASVVAHEIGHGLGLQHTPAGSANLMASTGATSAQLSTAQIGAVFQTTGRNDSVAFIPNGGTGFPQPFTPVLAGDYNGNGVIDAGDYEVWRDNLGSTTNLAADGNGSQTIDAGDFTTWKNNFGRTAGAGAGGLGDGSVPEPATLIEFVVAVVVATAVRRNANRRRGGGTWNRSTEERCAAFLSLSRSR